MIEVAVIGVAAFMRTATSKASVATSVCLRCSSMPASSSSGSTSSLTVTPSPKRRWICPRGRPRRRKRSGQVSPSGFFFWPRCSIE